MKNGFLLLAFLCVAVVLRAQDAAQSSVDLGPKPTGNREATPSETPEATPIATPEAKPEVPELSELDQAFKQSSLGKAADEFKTRVEWRKLQNEVDRDPAVVAAKQAADSARTDLEKRERLRDYYEIYYGRMRARASSAEMKAALDSFKKEHLKLLAQPRVRPNSDLPMETPEPTRGKKKKK